MGFFDNAREKLAVNKGPSKDVQQYWASLPKEKSEFAKDAYFNWNSFSQEKKDAFNKLFNVPKHIDRGL
jgi:hypothetical protein